MADTKWHVVQFEDFVAALRLHADPLRDIMECAGSRTLISYFDQSGFLVGQAEVRPDSEEREPRVIYRLVHQPKIDGDIHCELWG